MKLQSLKFEKEIEAIFHHEDQTLNLRFMRFALVVVYFLFFLGCLLDHFYSSPPKEFYYLLFGVILPAGCLLVVLAFTPVFIRLHNMIVILTIILLTAGVLANAYYETGPLKEVYYNALLLVEIYALVLSRIRFIYALFSAAIILIGFQIVYFLEPLRNWHFYLAHMFLYVCGAALGLIASWFLEKYFRQLFLMNQVLRLSGFSLMTLANVDSLTQIANRRSFDVGLKKEWQRAMRMRYPLSLLLVDIDYFKEFNDGAGHLAGDQLLKDVADVLNSEAKRVGDLAARYGGDEFALVLIGADLDAAQAIAHRIIDKINDKNISHPNSKISNIVTVSIGVVTKIPVKWEKVTALIDAADQALYKAKNDGRNQMAVFKESTAP